MNALSQLFGQPWSQALAWTLIYFLWQGAVIGFLAYLVLSSLRLSPSTRYLVGVGAMAAMLAAPVVTLAMLTSAGTPLAPIVSGGSGAPTLLSATGAPDIAPAAGGLASVALQPGAYLLPSVVALWFVGVFALSVRLLGGWVVARRLARRAVQPVSPEIRALARRVAGRLALDRVVRLYESTAVAVPVTVGWFKPVVLIPVSALSGLSTSQVEALLAHELAHVRRHDYLVNLLQSAVETLLFYHPAVWWVSKVVRTEREHCCDDIAVEVCDRVVYVSALTDLAALNAVPRMALAATDGPLVSRVRRLLGHDAAEGESGSSWVPALVVLALAVVAMPVVLAQGGVRGETAEDDQSRAAGVSRGVGVGAADGVSRGVGVGVADAVDGGDARGVAAGVGTGVADGVTWSIGDAVDALEVAQTSAEQRQEARREAARLAELEQQRAAVARQVRQAQAEIEQERVRLEMAQMRAQLQAQASQIEAQMEVARQQLADAARRVEAGTLSRPDLAQFEMEVVQLEQQLMAARQQQQMEEAQMALRLREIEQRRTLEDQMMDVEAAIEAARRDAAVEMEARRADVQVREQTLEALLAEYRARLDQDEGMTDDERAAFARAEAQLRDLQAARSRDRVEEQRAMNARYAELAAGRLVEDPEAQARENDVLDIEISGESLLPRRYPVGTDGNIRLPLLGEVQVRGLTTAQVRDLLSSRLADRQLAQGATITVRLLRPGGSGRIR